MRVAGVGACPEGEGGRAGWHGEAVAGGLSGVESGPALPGSGWLCSMWSLSSSRRMPSWNISSSSTLEQGDTSTRGLLPQQQVWEAVPQSRNPRGPTEGPVKIPVCVVWRTRKSKVKGSLLGWGGLCLSPPL